MDLQTAYWAVGAAVAFLTVYNFVSAWGHKTGTTEEHGRATDVRLEALHGLVSLYQSQTTEKFERQSEKLTEALLTMAREHPTKTDLQHMKEEILDRIDGRTTPRRGRPPKGDEI
jgi:hypothetical protein